MDVCPEKIRVTKLHLLVHPGFLAGPDAEHEIGHPTQEEIDASRLLLDKYIDRANFLGSDEVMVIFGYATPDEFLRHRNEFAMYVSYISLLQRILGDRLILIEGIISLDEDCAFEEVKFIADERGFSIELDTVTEAFGETAAVCVLDCAQKFNVSGHFQQRTIIDLDLTDLSSATEGSVFVTNLVRDNRDSISRVLFRKGGRIVG